MEYDCKKREVPMSTAAVTSKGQITIPVEVRKKLGLNLVSEQTDKGRLYRIKDGKASPVAADRAKQAA